MTLLDLYDQITKIGRLFATWSIPMDKEVNLELKGDNQTGYYVEVTTKEHCEEGSTNKENKDDSTRTY